MSIDAALVWTDKLLLRSGTLTYLGRDHVICGFLAGELAVRVACGDSDAFFINEVRAGIALTENTMEAGIWFAFCAAAVGFPNVSPSAKPRSGHRANALLVGGGGSVCLIARQSTSFSASSSIRSASEKSIRDDATAPAASGGLRSVKDLFG